MERQRRWRDLTKVQQQAKLAKDSEYEIAVQNLSTEFYRQKRAGKPIDKQAYTTAKTALWQQYLSWAQAEGLYKEIMPIDELVEAETILTEQVKRVNELRIVLNQPVVRIQEEK